MSFGRMKEEARLRKETGELLARTGKIDAEHGEAVRGDEPPDELKRRETRVAAIEAAKTRLEAEQRGRGRQPDRDRNRKGADRTDAPSGI